MTEWAGWQCGRCWEYRVGGKILGAIKSMYEESTVCVRIGRKLGGSLKWM
jgi:hypothetical protein